MRRRALAAGHGDDVLDAVDLARTDGGRGGGGRVLDVEAQIDVADPGQRAQGGGGFLVDLLSDGGLVGGDLDENGHVAAIGRDLDLLDDAEGNDVAAKTRIFDGAKLFADLGVGEGGRAH